jgi:large subunit ribosomal protein L30
MANLIKVTLKRSISKCTQKQKDTLLGLGLRNRHQTKYLMDTIPIRGMVLKMQHMIDVELVQGDDSLRQSARIRKRRDAATAQGGAK